MESETPVESNNSTHQTTTSSPNTSTLKKTSLTLEDAHDELDVLLTSGRVSPQEVAAIKHVLKEVPTTREKVSKLKSLLGRSAKAQRDCKGELEETKKKLAQKESQVEKLSQKVETLASRPTHLDLLADFESNFDKALLHAQQQQQSGGQDTTSHEVVVPEKEKEPLVDGMLLQELSETKNRLDSLETLLANSKQRTIALEQECAAFKRKEEHYQHKLKSLQLELRMSQLETEHATRSLEDKTASLQEMSLEIDLLQKASVNASKKISQSESMLVDRNQVKILETQVQALQEWAQAAAEQKSLAMEHVRLLERQLQQQQQELSSTVSNTRVLTKKTSSLVIGAGDVGHKVLQLDEDLAALLHNEERIVLQWKFDVTPSDLSVVFSLLKGACDSSDKQARADKLIQDRTVTGGAAGETEAAFDVQNACTLVWSNQSSWVRPRTIKYSIEIVALKE